MTAVTEIEDTCCCGATFSVLKEVGAAAVHKVWLAEHSVCRHQIAATSRSIAHKTEAPTRVWVLRSPSLPWDGANAPVYDERPLWADDEPSLHEYCRADVARPPADLLAKGRQLIRSDPTDWTFDQHASFGTDIAAWARQALEWMEQQTND